MERVAWLGALTLLAVGLLFVAGGFGTFVAGHIEGLLLVFVGVAMSWAGWVGTEAKGLACLIAAALNTLDASVTLATWVYEVNPLVIGTGPTVFIVAKMLCSIAIVAFARTTPNPSPGGRLLAGAFAIILAWNFSQLALFSFRSNSLSGVLLWGTASSLAVVLATFMALALRRSRSE